MAVTVLVVDDSTTIRQQVGDVLRAAGYAVAEARDGVEGKARVQAGDLSCVICDVNMPNKSGLQMIEELQAEGRPVPPVILVTGEGDRQLVARAKAAGAKGWFVKPVNLDHLLAAVRGVTGPISGYSAPAGRPDIAPPRPTPAGHISAGHDQSLSAALEHD